MSTDGGTTYTQVGTDYNETSNTLVTDSVKITTTGKIRFKFLSTSSNRINFDDITFKGAGDPGITVTPTGGGDGGTPDTTATGAPAATRDVTVGNDAPLVRTIETWHAKSLPLVVRSVTDDPRTGKRTQELVELNQSEPDPGLFELPEGYRVVTSEPHEVACSR